MDKFYDYLLDKSSINSASAVEEYYDAIEQQIKKEEEVKRKPIEQVLMESCNKLRSNMSGINYMYFVMGLVFLKLASIKFEKRREEIMNSDESFGIDDPVFYGEKNVFYITEKARWSYIKDQI